MGWDLQHEKIVVCLGDDIVGDLFHDEQLFCSHHQGERRTLNLPTSQEGVPTQDGGGNIPNSVLSGGGRYLTRFLLGLALALN